ncbi:MAG: ABC transporter permease [Spirochaetes bacterium]|nr:ABC transporter permease [Spirochaetota bacterium]
MKLIAVFTKTVREMRRDILVVLLTVLSAALFIGLYKIITFGGTTAYRLIVCDETRSNALVPLIEKLRASTYVNGSPMLKVSVLSNRAEAEAILTDGKADAALAVPASFADDVARVRTGSAPSVNVHIIGNLSNPYYSVCIIVASTILEPYIASLTGRTPLITFNEKALGTSSQKSEFDMYVPGIFVLSVIMLLFIVAMTVARDYETGALKRLRLTRASAFDILGGITLAMLLLAAVSILATMGTAFALGFHASGPLWAVFLIGLLTAFSIIGAGLIIGCFSRTPLEAFVIANFPFILLMFFSGSIFPIPRLELFTVFGRTIALFDILPPTHAVSALTKVVTFGCGFNDIVYELAALTVLSLVYFIIGVASYKRMRLSATV